MVVIGSAALVASLSLLGQLVWPLPAVGAGPPEPVSPGAPPGGVPRPGGSTSEEPVVVDAPGGRLAGAVVRPVAGGDGTALVLVAGGGPVRHSALLPLARALAAHGPVVLVHDKRTAGYGALERDYPALGRDALAALRTLRGLPGVDPARAGLAGISEGGWVVPAAAAAPGRDGPAFAVLLAGPVVTPGEQVQTPAHRPRGRRTRPGQLRPTPPRPSSCRHRRPHRPHRPHRPPSPGTAVPTEPALSGPARTASSAHWSSTAPPHPEDGDRQTRRPGGHT